MCTSCTLVQNISRLRGFQIWMMGRHSTLNKKPIWKNFLSGVFAHGVNGFGDPWSLGGGWSLFWCYNQRWWRPLARRLSVPRFTVREKGVHRRTRDPLPSCVGDLLPARRRPARAGRVLAGGRCVCPSCAAPRRSAHTPAKWRWRARRRTPQTSTPRRPDRRSCTWCRPGWLRRRREKKRKMSEKTHKQETLCSVLPTYAFFFIVEPMRLLPISVG